MLTLSLLVKHEVLWSLNGLMRCRSCSSSSRNNGPLAGVRILDMTRILAGPFCTMTLGDLGADVIKVELPKHGDDTRHWGPPFTTSGESAYFLSVNRNKRSITVNLKTVLGRQIVYDMVKKSDVLVENYMPGKMDELGLGYETLSELNPRLIYASISGFGPTGPYSNRAGYDVIASAMGGLMHVTGPHDGDAVKVGVAITDMTAGLFAHGAIMAALIARGNTGRGQKIDCSLLESQVATLANVASNYLIAGAEAKRMGTQHSSIVPYQAFKTSGGSPIIFGAGNNKQFAAACRVFGLAHISDDVRFENNSDRVKNRTVLINKFEERILEHDTKYWLARLEGCGFPYGPINSISEVFSDPQVLHRGMVVDVEHPAAGNVKLVGPPVKYSDTPSAVYSAPPTLSQHTDIVLTEILGYSASQIQQLRDEGII